MNNKPAWVVFLLSITIISVELIWTRIFSAEFFYTFAFLILSMAILGLGLGALLVRLFPKLYNENLIGGYLTLSGLTAAAFPPIVISLGLKFSQLMNDFAMVAKLALVILMLGIPFLFAGMVLAIIFRKFSKDISRIYMFDLIGAGIGVLIAIWLMNCFGTPFAVFLSLVPIFIAAILTQPKWMKIFPLIFLIGLFFYKNSAPDLLESERKEYAPVIYKHWDAMSKLKIFDFSKEYRGINIDNIANTPVHGFDGDYNVPDSLRQWSIDVSYLIQQFDSCRFLSLGAGGGGDVLQALIEGAGEVHAVEVNGHINRMMTEGDSSGYIMEVYARTDTILPDTTLPDSIPPETTFVYHDSNLVLLPEFSGNIYNDPRVKVVTEDARTYVKRFENKFDMIYSLSSNTWAALASGSFALAENYIFTTEAYEDYWNALSDSGFMMMEHQFYMPRLVTEIVQALKNQGVVNYQDHFAIYDLPKMRRKMLLLSKRPLDDSLRYYAFGELTDEVFEQIHLLYPPADSLKDNLINRIVEDGWQVHQDTIPIDISPATDNRPFVAQMGLWKNFKFEKLDRILPYEFYGYPLAKLIIWIIVLFIIILIIPLTLIPYFLKQKKLGAMPYLYFFMIGFSFMAFEIVLIQKYTLFVGASVYTAASILATLLIASGIGSRFSEKVNDIVPFVGILVWFIIDWLAFSFITSSFSGLEIGMRMFITCLLVAPLGFFMGMPFPMATRKVGELVDWGFAVNGAASVLGGTIIVLIAVVYGFSIALTTAVVGYLIAMLLLLNSKGWSEA